MQLIKSIDTSMTYNTFETNWWLHNDVIPNSWERTGMSISKRKWESWLAENFKEPMQTTFITKSKKKQFLPQSIVCVAMKVDGHDILAKFKYGIESKKEVTIDAEILWTPKQEELAKSIILSLNKIVLHKTEKSQVYMVVQDESGLDLRSFDINIPELDVELNYGKEWAEKHEYLLSALAKETKKGIALLHGLPGTGKSMYIRYLISILAEERTMIYLPNQLIPSITDPGFLPLMADYPNSVIIIEDAEEAIKSRKQGGAIVDKLLNLSDGIISDFLGTQIICTFNNDLAAIDEALLRKGRLILKHEFKRLSKEQAQKLSDKLGNKTTITKDMTLSEVYNQEEQHSEEMKERETIGFRSSK